eukprot:4299476-Ditylum_brightwellii.AAC.1
MNVKEGKKACDECDVDGKPVVNIQNLTFSYDKSSGKNTFCGLNCKIEPNSKIVLVGANGAGKSTLL